VIHRVFAVADPAPPKGATRYAPGTKVRVTAQPSPGKSLASVKVDGKVVTGDVVVTMNEDHAVSATFEDGIETPDGGAAREDAGSTAPNGAGNGGNGGGCAMGGESGGAPGLLGLGLALNDRA
jgi:hypothetical protein